MSKVNNIAKLKAQLKALELALALELARAKEQKPTLSPQERCINYAKEKFKTSPKATVKSVYKRIDGSQHKSVDIHFKNGVVMRVGKSKFWKVA